MGNVIVIEFFFKALALFLGFWYGFGGIKPMHFGWVCLDKRVGWLMFFLWTFYGPKGLWPEEIIRVAQVVFYPTKSDTKSAIWSWSFE